MSGRRVYFEHTTLGDVARLAAVDEETGIEAVVMGPARMARRDLEALGLRKLEYLLQSEAPPTALPGRKNRGHLA